jgi:competence protein ComEC
MRYLNLPLLQVCLVFVFGIWLGFSDLELDLIIQILFSAGLFVLLITLLSICYFYPKLKWTYSIVALIFIFSLGNLHTQLHLPKHQNNHYSHLLSQEMLYDGFVTFEGKIVKPLKANAYKEKFEVELNTLQGKPVHGKVLFQVPIQNQLELSTSHKVYGYGKIKAFKDPSNPQQFNYKDYMFTQRMSHVIDSEAHQLQLETLPQLSFIHLGVQARNRIQTSLNKHDFSKDQMDLIQALLLGQKQDINPETYNQFSRAGAVHILAVSGLHVGIILLILQFLTKGLTRLKYGKPIRALVVLFGIWGFAMLAGFSPSVLRAAVMFSFLSIALNARRKTSAINTLALSAVFLLLFNPYLIHHVGFQLSYFAVISIVTLQPRLSKLYQPKFYLSRKAWDIITVTISAQLGVLPLSLYYFHQFPGMFLLSNLVILPGLGLLLGGGILVICLSLLNVLPDILVDLYGFLLDALLNFIRWVASKEDLVFSDIYFTKSMLIASLAFVLSLILWDSRRKILSYSMLNLSLLALMICVFVERQNQLQQNEMLVFQTFRSSQLGILDGSFLNLFSDVIQPKDSIEELYHLQNYKSLRGVKSIELNTFRSVYEVNGKEILYVIDSIPVYPKQDFQPKYLLLKNSPDINLDRMISELKPQQIIADGSNYKSDIDLWRASAKKHKVNFHSTWDDDAFVFPKD